MNDFTLQCELFDLFFEQTAACLQEMGDACKSRNIEHWREAAHQMKGVASALGFNDLSERLSDVQRGSPSRAELATLRSMIADARACSERYRAPVREIA